MAKGERGSGRPYRRGKIWWIRFSVPGEGRERFESSKSENKIDAVRLLNKRRREIDERQVTSTDATLNDLFKLYLEDQHRQSRRSHKQTDGYVRLHLGPAFGEFKASRLETKHVRGFIDQKKLAGYSNASINRWLEALRRSYALGLKELPPLVYAAPEITELMLDERDNVREGFLEHEQYVRLRDELPEHQRLVLVIGYHLGMRRGEILKLRWEQIDWAANLIRLEKKQTKAKQARVAPLYGELRSWLDLAYTARELRCPYVISWRGQGVTELKTAWSSARRRASLEGLLVHDLRRTAIRNMIRAGIPEKRAMMISGHKSRSIFDRYNITDERDVQLDGERLARYLEQAARSSVRTKVRTVEECSLQAVGEQTLEIQ